MTATSARVYGIDFGTSNSAVRIGRADGSFVWVKDPGAVRGSWSIPSSVLLTPAGELLVGHAAERARMMRPQNYRAEFKRDVGDGEPITLGAEQFLPHELVARVLRFLRELAAATVDGEPDLVLLTVPARRRPRGSTPTASNS
jgi:molecular chaperone DnaK (HSP70)